MKLFLLILTAAIIYYLAVLIPQQKYYHENHVEISGTFLLHPLEIPQFKLTDTHENKFTMKNLQGHWTLLFAGFTHCNSICPGVMDVLAKTYVILKSNLDQNKLPQIVFLTVDPERDTPQRLKDFVASHHSGFIGIRGGVDETISLQKQLHVISNKIGAGKNYNINHGGDILLINPQGKIQAYFRYPQHPNDLAKDYQDILKKMDNHFSYKTSQ